MGFSDYQHNLWLSQLTTGWVALHYDNPDVAGAYASEVFGGSYARQKVLMTDPSSGVLFNSTAITFNGLPAVTVTHVAGWDAQVNGNYIWSALLPIPVRILAGRSLPLASGQIALSMDPIVDQ